MEVSTAIAARKSKISTRKLVSIAMLAAVTYALAFIEFPVPFAPNVAKVDLSYFPALIASFAFGPLAGNAVEFVKNSLQLLSTSTFGIGELANFLIGSSLVSSAGMIYKRRKTRKGAWLACFVGSIFMGAFAAFLNYFVLFPLYGLFMPVDAMIASFSEVIPFIQTKFDFCVLNALPFTALKGLFTSFATLLVYKRLSTLLKASA